MSAQLRIDGLSNPSTAQRVASALRRTAAVIERVLRMDASAMVRARGARGGGVDLFISTPLGCVLSQRLPDTVLLSSDAADLGAAGTAEDTETSTTRSPTMKAASTEAPGSGDVVIMAEGLPALLTTHAASLSDPTIIPLGQTFNLMWSGALPPQQGFVEIDRVPAEEIRRTHQAMGKENQDAQAPGGVARSLLDQRMVEVASDNGGGEKQVTVALTGRMIAAIGGAGLAAKPAREELRSYDIVRVSATGSWIRVDGLFGTMYAPRPGGLARVPTPN